MLAKEKKIDYLLIELTCISEPLPLAETFVFGDENGDVSKLDTMVTFVGSIYPGLCFCNLPVM